MKYSSLLANLLTLLLHFALLSQYMLASEGRETIKPVEKQKSQEEAAKKEEALKKAREDLEARQEQLKNDMNFAKNLQKTIDDPKSNPNQKKVAELRLKDVTPRITDNQQQIRNLSDQVETLLQTPELMTQKALYQQAFDQKLRSAQGNDQVISTVRTEFDHILRGDKSFIQPTISFADYAQQRSALEQLKTALEALNVSDQNSQAASTLLAQLEDRLVQLDTFVPKEPLAGNKLDADLKLSTKIPADQIRELELQLKRITSLPTIDEKIRVARETQDIIKNYNLQDKTLQTMLDQKIADLNLDKTPLAKKLNLGIQTPEKQADMLAKYVWEQLEQPNTNLSPDELKQMIDTANAYGLESQQEVKDFISVLEERGKLEQEAAKSRTLEVTDEVNNAVKAIAETGQATAEQAATLLSEGAEAVAESATKLSKQALAVAAQKVGGASQAIGEGLATAADFIDTAQKLANFAANTTNEVQLILGENKATLETVKSILPPKVGKMVETGENLPRKVENLATGPIGQFIAWVAPKAESLAQAGKAFSDFGKAATDISDKIREGLKDPNVEAQKKRDFYNQVEKLVAAERESLALFKQPEQESVFAKIRSTVKQYITDLVTSIKNFGRTSVEQNLVQANANFDLTRELYARWLVKVTQLNKGKNPKNLSKEDLLNMINKVKNEGTSADKAQLLDYNKRLVDATNAISKSLQTYAGSLNFAQQSLEFTVDAWDNLVMDENASALDLINDMFALRQQKMEYLQSLKENVASLNQIRNNSNKSIEALNDEFINQITSLIDGSMLKNAVGDWQFIEQAKSAISEGRMKIEAEIASKNASGASGIN